MKRVLVIDDEPTIRELVAEGLREAGYRVDAAANGAAGLRVMRRRVPDAIVLDLMMPQLDGAGFAELMRLNPRFASVPIVLATASYDPLGAAERIGAKACIPKPFELEQLIQAVKQLIGEPLPSALVASADPLPSALVASAAIEQEVSAESLPSALVASAAIEQEVSAEPQPSAVVAPAGIEQEPGATEAP